MTENIEITLNFHRNHFEEIYFKNNQGSYIHNTEIKPLFRNSVILLMVFVLLFFYTKAKNEYEILIIPFIPLIVFIFKYLEKLAIIQKWKKSVIRYLNEQEQYISHKLILSNNSLSVIQDGQETIEKWTNFTSIKILDDYISLNSSEHFLIPKKSVTPEEFQILKKIISAKTK